MALGLFLSASMSLFFGLSFLAFKRVVSGDEVPENAGQDKEDAGLGTGRQRNPQRMEYGLLGSGWMRTGCHPVFRFHMERGQSS